MNHQQSHILKIILKIFSLFLFVFSFGQKSVKNDDKIINDLIISSEKNNKPIVLEKDKVYYISKPISISSSIIGNNATILPNIQNTVAISFNKENIKISDLNIKGNNYKMLDVTSNNIKFTNCNFETSSYFVLMRLSGNGIKFQNTTLINKYNKSRSYVIKNKENITINDLTIGDSKLYGAIFLVNYKTKKQGNYLFKNNIINVDFSDLNQDINQQNDGFHFEGITGINFTDNKIYFKNVNRGFKMTNFDLKNLKNSLISNPTSDVIIQNNIIESNSINGKQLFDFYNGTAKVDILNNKIKSIGHSTVFEDKTTAILSKPRIYTIKGNTIEFDFRIAYIRGSEDVNKLKNKVSVDFSNNQLYYVGKGIKSKKRIGSDLDFENNYLVYVRSLNTFNYLNNKLNDNSNYLQTIYNIYVNDITSSRIEENEIYGGILIRNNKPNALLEVQKNTVKEISKNIFLEVVEKTKFLSTKNNIILNDNVINSSNKKIRISNFESNNFFKSNYIKAK